MHAACRNLMNSRFGFGRALARSRGRRSSIIKPQQATKGLSAGGPDHDASGICIAGRGRSLQASSQPQVLHPRARIAPQATNSKPEQRLAAATQNTRFCCAARGHHGVEETPTHISGSTGPWPTPCSQATLSGGSRCALGKAGRRG